VRELAGAPVGRAFLAGTLHIIAGEHIHVHAALLSKRIWEGHYNYKRKIHACEAMFPPVARFLDAQKYLAHFSIWKDFLEKLCMGKLIISLVNSAARTSRVPAFPMISPMPFHASPSSLSTRRWEQHNKLAWPSLLHSTACLVLWSWNRLGAGTEEHK
jgi:hypothetical protein